MLRSRPRCYEIPTWALVRVAPRVRTRPPRVRHVWRYLWRLLFAWYFLSIGSPMGAGNRQIVSTSGPFVDAAMCEEMRAMVKARGATVSRCWEVR